MPWIARHNAKLTEKTKAALGDLKSAFWSLMRWKYDQTTENYTGDRTRLERGRG
jgi:hypothetical protein